MIHTKAWGMWVIAALLAFTLTRNPFYLFPALAAVAFVYVRACQATTQGRQWNILLQLGLSLALFSVLYNILFVSAGATKLATLPALRLTFSEATIQIGGALTLESLTFALLQAASLMGLLLAFAAFNACADHYELLKSAPRFLYQSALVLSIAVTFVPQMMVAQAEIREAQMLRGYQFRKTRDLLPLFITLLAEGLEHSITLAESMSARGFGGQPARGLSRHMPLWIACGLGLVLLGAAALTYMPEKIFGAAALGGGGVLLTFALWRIGARVHITRYRRAQWQRRDVVVAVSAAIVIATYLGALVMNDARLSFYPYPRLKMPALEFWLLAVNFLLAVPALIPQRKSAP